jgi:hypothetical protein
MCSLGVRHRKVTFRYKHMELERSQPMNEKTDIQPYDCISGLMSASSKEQILREYKQLRTFCTRLSEAMLKSASTHMIGIAGRRLGLLRGKIMDLHSEGESAVLMDYCLYHVRNKEGRNLVDTYFAKRTPVIGSDELLLKEAMSRATFTMIAVEAPVHGVGLHVLDLISGERHFMVDVSLSRTSEKNDCFAVRLLRFETFSMSTGAGLPLGSFGDSLQVEFAGRFIKEMQVDQDGHADPANIIRGLLVAETGRGIQFKDVGKSRRSASAPVPRAPQLEGETSRVGRNHPCPCGSGRKFKSCCINLQVDR